MRRLILVLVLIGCAACKPISGASSRGGVDLRTFDRSYGVPKVRIAVGGTMLHLAAWLARDDTGAGRLLGGLDSVHISVYELSGEEDPGPGLLGVFTGKLQAQDWEQVVTVNDDDEQVRVLVKFDDEVIAGLVVVAIGEDREAVIINVTGEIKPDQVGAVARALEHRYGRRHGRAHGYHRHDLQLDI